MPNIIRIDGTNYNAHGGYTKVDGTIYNIAGNTANVQTIHLGQSSGLPYSRYPATNFSQDIYTFTLPGHAQYAVRLDVFGQSASSSKADWIYTSFYAKLISPVGYYSGSDDVVLSDPTLSYGARNRYGDGYYYPESGWVNFQWIVTPYLTEDTVFSIRGCNPWGDGSYYFREANIYYFTL